MLSFDQFISNQIQEIKDAGLYKSERLITSQQSAEIEVANDQEVLNFCANNYLGLANNPDLIKEAQKALDKYGFGMASVRFICGTQDVHKELEARISKFTRKEDTILYAACFDANGGLFEPLFTAEDAIISDSLNHASIIDGIRLCKAQRYRYNNSDMEDLERCLKEADAKGTRHKIIATDGVFSMDGYIAKLPEVCALAKKYDALVMIDDCHAAGFMGPNGGGSADYHGVTDQVDIITGTLGKALGGAMGGYVSASKPVIDMLRQRSRPYLFSNTLAPVIAATSIAVLDMLDKQGAAMRKKLQDNSEYFRGEMGKLGFDLLPGEHPIIPVMLYDAPLAAKFADKMLKRGVYVVGFSFPVVPKGQARIRTQMSCAHDKEHLDRAIAAFAEVGRELGVIKEGAA